MFIPEFMEKVNIFLARDRIEDTIRALAQREILHIVDEETGDWQEESTEWKELAERYSSELEHLEHIFDVFGLSSVSTSQEQGLPLDSDLSSIDAWVEEATRDMERWQRRKDDLEERIEFLQSFRNELQSLAPLDVPLQNIRNPDFLHWVVGTLPEENLETLQVAISCREQQPMVRPEKRVTKMYIFIPEDKTVQVANALVNLDGFKMIEAEDEGWSSTDSYWDEQVDQYLSQYDRMKDIAGFFHISLSEKLIRSNGRPLQEFDRIQSNLDEIEQDIDEWNKARKSIQEKIEDQENRISSLRFLARLDVPMSSLEHSKFLRWEIGSIPAEELDSVQLDGSNLPITFIPIEEKENRVVVFAGSEAVRARDFHRMLHGIDFESVAISTAGEDTPAAIIENLQVTIEQEQQNLGDLEQKRRVLAEHWQNKILALWQQILNESEVTKALARFGKSGDLFVVAGKMTQQALERVLPAIENATREEVNFELLEANRGSESVLFAVPLKRRLENPLEIFGGSIPFLLVPIALRGERVLIIAVTVKERAEFLDRTLNSIFLERIPLPENIKGAPHEILPEIEGDIEKLETQYATVVNQIKEYQEKWRVRMMAAWQQISRKQIIASTITRLPQQHEVYAISGWVPESRKQELDELVVATTADDGNVEYLASKRRGRRVPPSLMQLPWFIRPFRILVETFGIPVYGELDPTLFAALSFILMYGMMFGDVGHGLVLGLAGLVLALTSSRGTMKSFGVVLSAAGFSGMVFGVLYGSIFGVEDFLHPLWLSPVSNVMGILTISIVGGVALLTIGMLLSIINVYLAGDWEELFFGQRGITGLLLYAGLIGGIYGVATGSIGIQLILPMIGIPAALMFFKEPIWNLLTQHHPIIEGNILTFLMQALIETFESLITFGSNSISFIRLGAFAVAHAVFMQVIFTISGSLEGVWSWLIIILGSVLVIGFEGLVVGIQAMRLEYYEFFSKFYTGMGYPYRPLQYSRSKL